VADRRVVDADPVVVARTTSTMCCIQRWSPMYSGTGSPARTDAMIAS